MRWEEAPGSVAPPLRSCARLESMGPFIRLKPPCGHQPSPSLIRGGSVVGIHVLVGSVNDIG